MAAKLAGKLALGGAVLGAVGGIFGVFLWASIRDGAQIKGAEDDARLVHYSLERSIEIQCDDRSYDAREKCAQEIRAGVLASRLSVFDLSAQRSMAIWTRVMGLMALAGTLLSPLGIYLLYATFRETKRAAETAQGTHEAFVALEGVTIKAGWFGSIYLDSEPVSIQATLEIGSLGKNITPLVTVVWRIDDRADFKRLDATHKKDFNGHSGRWSFDVTEEMSDWMERAGFMYGLIDYQGAFDNRPKRSYFCFEFSPNAYRKRQGKKDIVAAHTVVRIYPHDMPADT